MPANADHTAATGKETSIRPINWLVTVAVFFAGSVLLWADRSNFSVAAAAWAKDLNWAPSTIGLMLSAFSLGYLVIQPIGGWIADRAGPRRTLAGSMAGWSLWVLLTPLTPTVLWLTATFRVLLGAFEAPYVPASVAAVAEEANERAAQAPIPNRLLVTSPALWPFYIGYFALPYCQYIFLTWLPQYLTHYRHIPLLTASALSALPFVVAFISANFAGWAMDWMAESGWTAGGFHRKFFVALGAAIYAVTTLIAATTESNTLAVTLIVIANAGLAFYVVPYWTICTDVAPNQTGTLGGVMNFFGIVGATVSPYLSGVIAEATGAFVAPLLLAVAIMLVAATTMILLFRIKPLTSLVAEAPGAAKFAA